MASGNRNGRRTFAGGPGTTQIGRRDQTIFGARERARRETRLRDVERAHLGEGRWRDPVMWYSLWATVTLLALATLILVSPLGSVVAHRIPAYHKLTDEHTEWVYAITACARIVVGSGLAS